VKRKLVVAFLVCFALWPALQHALVRSQGVDPWRLFAWGMYSAPGSMRTVRVVVLDSERPPRVLRTRNYTPAEEEIITIYRTRRQALGRLASANGAAQELLALHPEWQGVALPVLSLTLDRQSARTMHSIAQHTTWRDAEGDAYTAALDTFATP
jgi:hypothetical protein